MKLLENERMRKIHWGIIAGICLIVIFYVTASIIAAFIITNAVAAATNSSVGLFNSWWQTLLFIVDILFVLLFAGALTLRVLIKRGSAKAMTKGGESL